MQSDLDIGNPHKFRTAWWIMHEEGARLWVIAISFIFHPSTALLFVRTPRARAAALEGGASVRWPRT